MSDLQFTRSDILKGFGAAALASLFPSVEYKRMPRAFAPPVFTFTSQDGTAYVYRAEILFGAATINGYRATHDSTKSESIGAVALQYDGKTLSRTFAPCYLMNGDSLQVTIEDV